MTDAASDRSPVVVYAAMTANLGIAAIAGAVDRLESAVRAARPMVKRIFLEVEAFCERAK